MSAELFVRVFHVYPQPHIYIPLGGMHPDPRENISFWEYDNITFRVDATDSDGNYSHLFFNWSVDGESRGGNGTNSYRWRTGSRDAGRHLVVCRVSDGLSYIDAVWNIFVGNTNGPPVIYYLRPLNDTDYAYGATITFEARATDPDWDPLTFYWDLSDGTHLRTDAGQYYSQFSMVLPGGKQHIVVLTVVDGQGGLTMQFIYIKVKADIDEKPGSPCSSLPFLIAPFMLAAATTMAWDRKGQ